MSNTQLKIRIRLDQTIDHSGIDPDSTEHPESSLLPPSHPVYEYHWPRIIGALLILLFIFTAFFWVISAWISDNKEPEVNLTETISSTASSVNNDSFLTEPTQLISPTDEPLLSQPSGNSPTKFNQLSEEHSEPQEIRDLHDASLPVPASTSLTTPDSPIKPSTKPDVIAFQPKKKTISKINHSAGLVKAQLTSNIYQRSPIDNIDKISLAGKPSRPIFLFLHFNKFKDKKIFVNWYYHDKRAARVTLPVGNNDWRTYSSKILNQNRLGSWHVMVKNQSGKPLAQFKFSVTR